MVTIRILATLLISWLVVVNTTQAAVLAAPGDNELATIAADTTWLKLIHYEASNQSESGWLSAIHNPDFFLDEKNGPTDPLAELKATLQAISSPATTTASDEHAQCRFPARTMWLRERIKLGTDLPTVPCRKWDAWAGQGQIQSVSLVLASGFLGNPASYYGHTLLKFNTIAEKKLTALQERSVSYGVIENGQDNPLVYITKGILGGYEGGFSDIEYYFHRNQYGEIELRDLWEYELNLTKPEVNLITAHAWEILNRQYQYFFFRKNCAFRMAEIIQLIDGVNITPENRPWTIPQATIQTAGRQLRADGTPLLKSVHYAPSRQNRFYASFEVLQPHEQEVFFSLVDHAQALQSPAYQSLSPSSQRAVIDATIDYHQFITDAAQRTSGKLHPVYAAALAERFKLPPDPKVAVAVPPEAPHLGRPPGWMQMGWINGPAHTQKAYLRIRAAYYDPLDSDQGHVPNSGLTMGDTRLAIEGGRIKLDQLHLLIIDSANPGVTGLSGDRGQVWRLIISEEPVKPGCEDCLTSRLQADLGMGHRLGNGLFAAARVGGAIQSKTMQQGNGFAKIGATLIWRPENGNWGTHINLEARQPLRAREGAMYGVTLIEGRYAIDKTHDVRLRYEHSSGFRGGSRALIGLGAYW